MRLIDADALLVKQTNIAKTFARSDAQKSLMGRVMYNTEHAPTIDAIPVEWLEQKRKCSDPESVRDINGAFVTICIDGVLVLWQKEQEART